MLACRSMRLRSVRGYSVLANNGAEVATPGGGGRLAYPERRKGGLKPAGRGSEMAIDGGRIGGHGWYDSPDG